MRAGAARISRFPTAAIRQSMLEVRNLKCVRGGRTLFEDLSFTLAPGAWLHLRGANGAGKTSLLRILCGLAQPAAGSVAWRGAVVGGARGGDRSGDGSGDRYAFRAESFYLGHLLALNDVLSVAENLRFCCALAGNACDDAALRRALATVGLRGLERRLVRNLSWGQRRRVALARLVLTGARLWILDEPFVALDAAALAMLDDLIAGHLTAGGMAVVTSHQDVRIGRHAPQVLELAA